MSFAGSMGEAAARSATGMEGELLLGSGCVRHAASTQAARTSDAICILDGEPLFTEPGLAATAKNQGSAHAWVQAFAAYGAEAPRHVRGRFAVVLLLPQQRRAYMATDRFGTWPVCYAQSAANLHFADRADTVPLPGRGLSPQALFDYLYFHCIPAPQTVFDGVARLPAGHAAMWADGRMTVSPYAPAQFDEDRRPDLAESKRRFIDIVRASVRREAGPGRVGAFLSGGTDSSTVAGMLGQVLGQPADTYSIGFDAGGYDEMAYARIASRHFGTHHHEYYVTPDDLLAGIPKVAAHYDQPFGNSSAVPAWICARRAHDDGIHKLLAGDGGDELFGGNTRYAKQRVFGAYDTVPRALRSAVLEPLLGMPGMNCVPLVKKGVSYVEQARVPMPDRMQMYNLLWRLGPGVVLEPGFLSRIDLQAPLLAQREVWGTARAGSLLNRMLAFDWKYTLADNDLPKVIGTAALAGVEVGFPLLSDELVDFSLGLPPEWKLKGMTLRWFFKAALRGFLPDEIIAKKKHGFGLPFGVWACSHGPLQALTADALRSLSTRGVVRADFIATLLDEHLPEHPGYYGEMVWILMTLEFWLREHAPDWKLGTQ
jgi:asparagine synthase (glutamine-hydrolysing)